MMQALRFSQKESQITCMLSHCRPRICPSIRLGFLSKQFSNVIIGNCSCNYCRRSFCMAKISLGYFSAGHYLINAVRFSPSSSDICVSLSVLRPRKARSRLSNFSSSVSSRSVSLLDRALSASIASLAFHPMCPPKYLFRFLPMHMQRYAIKSVRLISYVV